jgi:hypothetical protein
MRMTNMNESPRPLPALLRALLVALPALACRSSTPNCGDNPAGYAPHIDPANFSTTIDNKYLSYVPGTVFKYTRTDGNLVEQDVSSDTKTILGVKTVVVHDFLKTPAGDLLEDTYDYYAQDEDGNVWYFGEQTTAFSGKTASRAGSWTAGVGCAHPGIVMLANPQVGKSYRQEYLAGEAEDEAEVVSLSETVNVPYGALGNCVETKEHTALAPGDVENKYYCPGVGEVLAHDVGTIDAGNKEELATIDGHALDCSANPANYLPTIDPATFSTTIDNPWLPYVPGTVFQFSRTDGNIVEQDVTYDTKAIMGVTTVVVHDFMKTPEGELLEDTYDYFAQDEGGAVWYFGESTKAYSGALVSTDGTWAGGLSCARPGIVMPGHPKVGDSYRQEYLPSQAEDQAKIVSLAASITAPYGTFDHCLETEETTALAPGDIEHKYYCPGVGVVVSADVGTIDMGNREELAKVNGRRANADAGAAPDGADALGDGGATGS